MGNERGGGEARDCAKSKLSRPLRADGKGKRQLPRWYIDGQVGRERERIWLV